MIEMAEKKNASIFHNMSAKISKSEMFVWFSAPALHFYAYLAS